MGDWRTPLGDPPDTLVAVGGDEYDVHLFSAEEMPDPDRAVSPAWVQCWRCLGYFDVVGLPRLEMLALDEQ